MADEGIPAIVLIRAIVGAQNERRYQDAVDAIVEAYYAEFTDATELDDVFHEAFRQVFDLLFPFGETPDGREFEDVIKKP